MFFPEYLWQNINKMVYTFCKYADETLVTFSDIHKKDNGEEYIRW